MPYQNRLATLCIAHTLVLGGCAGSRFQVAMEFGSPKAESSAIERIGGGGLSAHRSDAAPAETDGGVERGPSHLRGAAIPVAAPLTGEETATADDSAEQIIDLAAALAMGGADHLQIALARERVVQAHSEVVSAQALRLPSLRFGIGWNRHDGRLQETQGSVLEVSRNSLFIGGGAGLGGPPPLAGGSSGPARLAVNLSLADAYFAPLIAERQLDSAHAAQSATFNDALLQIAQAYVDLVAATGLRANAQVSLGATRELVKLSRDFLETGAGAQSEVDRASTERGAWETTVQEADRQVALAAAELARLLRIDRGIRLVPADEELVALEIIDRELPLDDLIDEGLASRPEMRFHDSQIASQSERVHQEYWRPWLPHIVANTSIGTFGGGPSSQFDNQSGRSDIDLLAVWEWKNLGYGNLALRQRAISQMRQAQFQADWTEDQIRTQIVTAFADVQSFAAQIESTRQQISDAQDSYDRNLKRVRQGRGLPIELIQAIRAQATSLSAHTRSISRYNRSQFRLLHAIGTAPAVADDPAPPEAGENEQPQDPSPAS